ncbi:MAG: DUF2335 domain-containing protein [Parvimonas sp.]|jgi:inner membrane protein|nr:DUF2335 domain-containing protein [Parvimonas sp.]
MELDKINSEKDLADSEVIIQEIDSLSEEERNKVLSSVTQEYTYSGILPHPMLLKQFDEVLPGTAERIITMTEKEGEHRRIIEKQIVDSEFKIQNQGIKLGFLIALVGILGSIFLAFYDKTIASTILGGSTLVSLVSVFIKGINTKK